MDTLNNNVVALATARMQAVPALVPSPEAAQSIMVELLAASGSAQRLRDADRQAAGFQVRATRETEFLVARLQSVLNTLLTSMRDQRPTGGAA